VPQRHSCSAPQVEHLDIAEAQELRKLRLLKAELGELAGPGGRLAAGEGGRRQQQAGRLA
jgi:hypothetical protein